jgi:monovalent cation:H+ antiporter-2, CPA2 family
MEHSTPLIATIVMGLSVAFVFGVAAHRLRMSPLVGYLLAGVVVGPFTPGWVADQPLANELAEIGVILLMFGVGLHFSLKDLLSVRAIAIPGAVAQITVATLLGLGLGWALGWPVASSVVFGLALSVASTVVLLRAVQERRLIETERGRIAVGWLIVEDLAMILALVLLPALSGVFAAGGDPAGAGVVLALGVTLGKVAVFVILMLVVGRRMIPWMLEHVAGSGSRELFRLAVLVVALGVAFAAAKLFGASFALGAFFAGMVLSESELSHEAAEQSLPLRDAFAVLFFVSVGMLFDPRIVLREPLPVLGTLLIIIVGKSVAAFLIVAAFRYPMGTALTISASLAQIGEFSFILAGLGVALGLLPEQARDLILAGAILSILANPFVFAAVDAIEARLAHADNADGTPATAVDGGTHARPEPTVLRDHAVVVGYGRVGSLVGQALAAASEPFVVIDDGENVVARLRTQGTEALAGNGAQAELLAASNVRHARRLFITIGNCFESGRIVEQARALNPALHIIARADSAVDVEHLSALGADAVIIGEREIARGMMAHMTSAPRQAATTRARQASVGGRPME